MRIVSPVIEGDIVMHFAAFPLGSSFRWKLAPALLVVAWGDWIFFQRDVHGGNFGFLALALLVAMIAGRPAVRGDRRAWAAIAAAAVFALALAYDASVLAWTLFWLAAGLASLIPLTARFDDGWRWALRLAYQGLRAPIAPLLDTLRVLRIRAAGRTPRRSLRAMLSLLALPLAGSVVILVLFSVANPLFERVLSSFMPTGLSPVHVLRAILCSVYFAMAWSLLRPRLATLFPPALAEARERSLPGVSVASVTLSLVVFNAIFALQNLLDLAYLWGLAAMPEGMTMAQYAHRGAYPLIVTALLAALFVLVALRPGSDTARARPIRALVTAWIAQNIFLVVSSMLRTIDYVEAYSLTRLRIAALAWMALVAFGLAAICWRALRGRSAGWLINVNLAAAGLALTAACFVDLGAVAAQWNVRHAREAGGGGAGLDLCYLDGLGDSAVLSLIELERRPGLAPATRERVQAVRLRLHDHLERDQVKGWTLLGQHRVKRARQLLDGKARPLLADGMRRCDGALVPPEPASPVIVMPPDPAPTAPNPVSAATPALTEGSR